jgi:vacuolar-type H+-ATPase subunit I/STV1
MSDNLRNEINEINIKLGKMEEFIDGAKELLREVANTGADIKVIGTEIKHNREAIAELKRNIQKEIEVYNNDATIRKELADVIDKRIEASNKGLLVKAISVTFTVVTTVLGLVVAGLELWK